MKIMTLGDKIQLLKKKITDVQIMDIMTELGIPHNFANENEVRYLTACHNGDSYKLYFYRSSKSFYCYTHCGALDIVNIVEKRLGYSTLDAYKYISRKIGLDFLDFQYGFGELNLQMSESFRLINKFSKNKAKKEWINFNIIDEKILNMFYPIYHKSFYNDGISIDVMKRFEIQFDLYNNRIIIPHRNWNGDLIAIRCRNLEQELIVGSCRISF